MLTKEDKTLIKNVWESKKYWVKRLIKEFPNKKWSKRGVKDFQKQLRTTGSIERAPSSGRPQTTHTAENVDAVGDLENQPQTHRSTRQISWELGKPQINNWRWLFTARRNARIASAVLATAIPSVHPSVRPSHAGIVSKRRHIARCSLHCRIAKCV